MFSEKTIIYNGKVYHIPLFFKEVTESDFLNLAIQYSALGNGSMIFCVSKTRIFHAINKVDWATNRLLGLNLPYTL